MAVLERRSTLRGLPTPVCPERRSRPRGVLWRLGVSAALLTALAPWSAFAQQPSPAQSAPVQSAQPEAPGPPTTADGASKPADNPTEDTPVSEEVRQEARRHFEKGIAVLREEAWAPALAEFLLSRSLYPTRAATNNAAIVLRKLLRYDESLDMFETCLRDFQVPAAERAAAQRAIAELRGLVGTIDISGAEPGAAIVVSGQTKGEYPQVKPIRVAAGTHIVRIMKEGYEPFEIRLDVAGGQTAVVKAKLRVLTRSGKLRIKEGTGKTVDVLVDNAVVGQTPWQGTLSVGSHMVALRGEGKLGTQPAAAPVKSQELTTLSLLAEELEASLRVDPTPPGASVWINSVNVGRGVWLGRLKTGEHRVEVKTDGFLPAVRVVQLEKGQRENVALQLERDDDAEIWRKPSKITVDVSTSFVVAPTFGGDVAGTCSGDCARSVGIGGLGLVHGGYEFGSGIGLGLEAGYLIATQDVEGRAGGLTPHGVATPNRGTVNDALRLTGFLAGVTAGYHVGERFPALFRLNAGVLVGQLRDERAGSFRSADGSSSIATYPVVDFPTATYFFVDPEIRLGARFARHFEVSAGVQLLMLIAVNQPKWDQTIQLAAGPDGIGTYPADALTGGFVLMVAPGVSLRYDL